jgi:hypothetical protein
MERDGEGEGEGGRAGGGKGGETVDLHGQGVRGIEADCDAHRVVGIAFRRNKTYGQCEGKERMLAQDG